MSDLSELNSDFEKAEYLQNLLVDHATGESSDTEEYQSLRTHFLKNPSAKNLLPDFVRTNRNLGQFWQFIKLKYPTYAERRQFIWQEFSNLLSAIESQTSGPSDKVVSDVLSQFNEEGVHSVWSKALDRKKSDPEGAITSSRTLLEAVCKHILDDLSVEYDPNKTGLPQLYKQTAESLNLAPSQHTEEVFKQILGGCSAIVNGLGTLRNRVGDAHGKGKWSVKPAPRHAELAVNLAGSLSLFLVETWRANQDDA